MDEIKVKFEIAGILAREEKTLLDRSRKLTDIFNILEKQLLIHGVVVPKGTLCKCKKPNRYYCKKTGGDRCRKCKTLL